MQTTRPAPGHVEVRFKPRQIAQAGDPRHRRAHALVGDKIEMLARLGNVIRRNGNLPRRRRGFLAIWVQP